MKYLKLFNESIDDNLQYDKLFIELSHLDELEIKFDFIEYEDYIHYFYNESMLFVQDKKKGWFYMNYDKIWSIFKTKFKLNYGDIQSITKKIVEKHFKLNDITTVQHTIYELILVEKHFKLSNITKTYENNNYIDEVKSKRIIDYVINKLIKPNEIKIMFDLLLFNSYIFLDTEYRDDDSLIIYDKSKSILWIHLSIYNYISNLISEPDVIVKRIVHILFNDILFDDINKIVIEIN